MKLNYVERIIVNAPLYKGRKNRNGENPQKTTQTGLRDKKPQL